MTEDSTMKSPAYGQPLIFLALSMSLWVMLCNQTAADDQRGNVVSGPGEIFKKGDEPYTIAVNDTQFTTPFGYNREANASLKYPLVVIGKWGEGKRYFNDEIRKEHPAFYLEFQYSSEADGARLADLIEAALGDGLRMDVNRILYTGFSAGGSGSFKLVRGMASKDKYFAAINRIAGQSESVMEKTATGKTALWLHIGLEDEPRRIEVSRTLYQNLKNDPINADAVETHISDTVSNPDEPTRNAERNTWILKKRGIEIVRYSEYSTCGHESWIGYADPKVFDWIFGRAIKPPPRFRQGVVIDP